jgi:uncharacterized integral membrane protein
VLIVVYACTRAHTCVGECMFVGVSGWGICCAFIVVCVMGAFIMVYQGCVRMFVGCQGVRACSCFKYEMHMY